MKKLLAIALIATSFVACNDAETKTDETKPADSTTVVTPAAVDTTAKAVDTTAKAATTEAPAADTTKK